MAVDAGHPARGKSLVRAGSRGGLLRKRHRGGRMAAATLGGVVRFQLLPNFLCERQAMTFVLGGRVEFAPKVSPHLSARLNMPYQARHELRWYMAVRTRGANAELIRVMRALRQFLEGRVHFMARSAKRDGFRVLKTANEAAGKSDADDEGQEAAGWYS